MSSTDLCKNNKRISSTKPKYTGDNIIHSSFKEFTSPTFCVQSSAAKISKIHDFIKVHYCCPILNPNTKNAQQQCYIIVSRVWYICQLEWHARRGTIFTIPQSYST